MIENGSRMYSEYNSTAICALRTKIQGIAVMYKKFNVTFHAIKSKMRDAINFELDPYSAFRKASEDAKVPDQPMWVADERVVPNLNTDGKLYRAHRDQSSVHSFKDSTEFE
ncbi:hypothetical protein P5673_012181 [Acropora cervicornis]|uniref:Uncharacterized protein n=1 Tax=Acropora cervicornis TaxID=6130 RepID=A0AAD9QNR2_ACRCE|nr:hypothetical protein P5673_012181 [Acropora cervicornis]